MTTQSSETIKGSDFQQIYTIFYNYKLPVSNNARSKFIGYFQFVFECFFCIYCERMEGRDGFRRRAAIIFNDKCKTTPEIELLCEAEDKLGKDNFIKFTKLNADKHAILNTRKKQQQFHKTIKQLQSRKCSFYRMGFRSYEKQGKKKLFGQVLGLNSNQMKGTMHVGQLWANHQVGKYFRQNKIFMTKLKLMDKLQTLKEENEQAQHTQSLSDIGAGSCKSIGTVHHFSLNGNHFSRSSTTSTNRNGFNHNLQEIKTELKQLKKTTGMRSLINDVKYLEKCKQNMERMERKYFLKMIDID